MAGYTKLHASILDSTVWDLSPPITKVWVTMMAMADRDGIVQASVPGLALRARVSRKVCDRALDLFASPDADSRTPDNDGRRIEKVDGGWRLFNHGKYRELMSKEDQREKNAARQRKFKAKKAAGNGQALPVTSADASNDIAEAEAQAGSGSLSLPSPSSLGPAGARSNGGASPVVLLPPHQRPPMARVGAVTPAFLSVFDPYPRQDGKQPAAQAFQEIADDYPGGETALAAAILAAYGRGFLKRHPYAGPNATRPMFDKVLSERRWEDRASAPDNEPARVQASARREL